MSITTKVTTKIVFLKKIKDRLRLSGYKEIGQVTVEEMKKSIAVGLSPVKEFGRFAGYSGERGGSYPFSVKKKYPDKTLRPVNLKLSGDMLNSLDSRSNGTSVTVGILSPSQVEKARKHQAGILVPQRKFIPTAGQEFTVSIMREIKKKLQQIIDRAIR